jgi:hypothetical protein
MASGAKYMLQQWNECYFSTRKRIEETSDHRWEFDRKTLFGGIDYLSEICGNIVEILDGLEGFKFFLSPQLRKLTGDSAIGMLYIFLIFHYLLTIDSSFLSF